MAAEFELNRMGVMIDCSRNAVMKPTAVKKWIDIMSDLGYNTLMLYTEDTYEVEHQPYFGYLRGRYTSDEIRDIDRYAIQKGIELMPCIQTLAHLNAIFRWDAYADILDCDDIMLAENEKTYALIEDIFSTLEKNFTSRTVNIGMDEAHMLGRGKYKDIHGWKDSVDVLLAHLNKVASIAKKHGFEILMWGDMFFRLLSGGEYNTNVSVSDEVRKLIPDNVNLVYWDYYSQDKDHYDSQIKAHAGIKDGIWFAGGLWSWTGFAPHNGYSMLATKAAMAACRDNGVKNVLFTMWGDNGGECSRFALLPSLYYAAQLAKGITDMQEIKDGFFAKYGIGFDDFCLLDFTGTPNGDSAATNNPEKYMLYSDLFLGVFDTTVPENSGSAYEACARNLSAVSAPCEFSTLFSTAEALCHVLADKWSMGIRLRRAYREGSRQELERIYDECTVLVDEIGVFYREFKAQWMNENKPYGFEVQDIRLGGLMQRIRSCQERLRSYLDGKIKEIEELEEDILPFNGGVVNGCQNFNNWQATVSANVL